MAINRPLWSHFSCCFPSPSSITIISVLCKCGRKRNFKLTLSFYLSLSHNCSFFFSLSPSLFLYYLFFNLTHSFFLSFFLSNSHNYFCTVSLTPISIQSFSHLFLYNLSHIYFYTIFLSSKHLYFPYYYLSLLTYRYFTFIHSFSLTKNTIFPLSLTFSLNRSPSVKHTSFTLSNTKSSSFFLSDVCSFRQSHCFSRTDSYTYVIPT